MERLVDFEGTLYEIVKKELLIAKLNSIFDLEANYNDCSDFEDDTSIIENDIMLVK